MHSKRPIKLLEDLLRNLMPLVIFVGSKQHAGLCGSLHIIGFDDKGLGKVRPS
jgi:hypothetical protein